MILTIILRTVCGCERMLSIPDRRLPPSYSVPYIRRQNWHVYPADGESCLTPLAQKRTFERTSATGTYGFPVYLEVLGGER